MELLSQINTKHFKFVLVARQLKLMVDAYLLGWRMVDIGSKEQHDERKSLFLLYFRVCK